MLTHYLCGVRNCFGVMNRLESTARSSGMKATTCHQSLSVRLTPLLISAGLVKGTLRSLREKKSGQLTLDFASNELGGTSVDVPDKDSSSWSEIDETT